jgi:glutamyl-tRNA reductase
MSTQPGTLLPLVVVGYDFRRASTRWRSKLVMKMDEQDDLAQQLIKGEMANGLSVLSTCNRMELIASSTTPDWAGQLLRARLLKRLKDATGQSRVPEPYVLVGRDAVRHLLRVAAGLESFVIGERQIASQLNCSMQTARKRGYSSVILNGLATACGRAARESTSLPISDQMVRGVHDASVRLLEKSFQAQDADRRVLVVGAGDIGRRVAQSVQARTRWQVTVVNRTVQPLAKPPVLPLSQLPELLATHDMMVVCTGAFQPLIGPEHLGAVDPERGLAIVDIGIPTQVDTAVRQIQGVTLTDLDGLEHAGVIDRIDTGALKRLDDQITEMTDEFARFCRERDMVTVLKTTQNQHERYVQEIIPTFINSELPDLTDEQRSRVAFKLNGLIREYTNSIFHSIHKTSTESNHDD